MRIVDPKLAQYIPVETELGWQAGMRPDERTFKIVYWDRHTDSFYEYKGMLQEIVLTKVPGTKEDYEWLRAIGAINGD